MQELKCGKCGHKFEKELEGAYPNGPCPINCPKCDAYICPLCGDNIFGVEASDEETRRYCGDGCRCGWEHCGGCI